MKKTLHFLTLAAFLALSSLATNGEAVEATAAFQACTASQNLGAEVLPVFLASETADALTCRQIFDECVAACPPEDMWCGQDCQCQYLNCRGYQCN